MLGQFEVIPEVCSTLRLNEANGTLLPVVHRHVTCPSRKHETLRGKKFELSLAAAHDHSRAEHLEAVEAPEVLRQRTEVEISIDLLD